MHSCYVIYIIGQIVTLYWFAFPCNAIPLNVNVFKLPVNFSIEHVKKQINVSNALFLCMNIHIMFSLESFSGFIYNFKNDIFKSSINYIFDPELKLGEIKTLSDGINTIQSNEYSTPKFNKDLA